MLKITTGQSTTITPECHLTEMEVMDGIRIGLLDPMGCRNISIISSESEFDEIANRFAATDFFRFKYGVSELLHDRRLQLRISPQLNPYTWYCDHRDLFIGPHVLNGDLPVCFEDRIVAAGFFTVKRGQYIIDGGSFELPTDEDRCSPNLDIKVSENSGLLRAKKLLNEIFPNRRVRALISSGQV